MEVVASRCINQQTCHLTASDDVFGNPCAGTFKALSVEAQCVGLTNTLVGGTVDQHETLLLQCPQNQKISLVAFASYGSPTGTVGTFETGWCDASSSVGVVQSLCAGQSSCAIQADDWVFGNPCDGTFKTLSVAVECADSSSARLRRRL
ncbi:hypothetical protein SDRG_17279 [Saprolegnia diclina VS20]|uniref:SUEL-type lectin domain-containing protein n=1 Tax=Saprolegnia diclina (strain VS20) TaxID=1156394 RepID=T0PHI8_SAPDV|nr:hypothetical protein SDRG_17279 [Saprolegnia diclina VS20]EQC24829.1 hypothetical protein SDRG_17279 [Saprolegnia diclina VS20]|eukprot:XP_008621741.1 hypothetical protein SDRG_17279 [Saprolegnia diclina VS20]